MSWGPGNGWLTWEVTASSVATLNSCGTPWHPRPRDNCETIGNVKTIEKKREQTQISESEFKDSSDIIKNMDYNRWGAFWSIHS